MNTPSRRPIHRRRATLATVVALIVGAVMVTGAIVVAPHLGQPHQMRTVADTTTLGDQAQQNNANSAGASDSSQATTMQIDLQGVQLTPAEVDVLRSGVDTNPGLTREQAAALVPAIVAQPAVEGDAESRGACGVARLWGDSYGHYRFGLDFYTEVVGTASVGAATVSTNAYLGADSQSFPVSGSYVGNDRAGDAWHQLSSIGWGATGTTLDGWSLTTGGWFCWEDLTANWKW